MNTIILFCISYVLTYMHISTHLCFQFVCHWWCSLDETGLSWRLKRDQHYRLSENEVCGIQSFSLLVVQSSSWAVLRKLSSSYLINPCKKLQCWMRPFGPSSLLNCCLSVLYHFKYWASIKQAARPIFLSLWCDSARVLIAASHTRSGHSNNYTTESST